MIFRPWTSYASTVEVEINRLYSPSWLGYSSGVAERALESHWNRYHWPIIRMPSASSTRIAHRPEMLRVSELFRSIQGESTHAGRPCTFVRLTGCPMRCVWCDSEYTFTGGDTFSIETILARVLEYGCNLVEVTGGEPLAQRDAFHLIGQLCDKGYEVLIETGGFFSTEDVDERAKIILDVKCPSSGEEARNFWPNLDRLRRDKDEVKFVIANFADWDYALAVIKRYDLEHRAYAVLISPVWGVPDLKEMANCVAESGMNVRLQLQMHKQIWGAEARGV